ncbi:MAG: hypothetical protein ACOYA9_00260 [Bilifractor sp.]
MAEAAESTVTSESEGSSVQTESSSEEDSSALTLDTNILERNDNVSTSLCDRFGVHMFSDEFISEVTSYDEKQKDEQDRILHDVLTNPETGKTEEAFQQVMQADTVTVVKADAGTEVSQNEISPIAYSLLGALIAGTVLFIIQKRQRKRHHENHDHSKEQEYEKIV